jgi:hypothetical protein
MHAMKALTQCWFTRMHIPEGRAHKEQDGSHTSWCRHCERPIISWDKARWFLADGFNVTHLAESVGGRFLFVLDTLEEAVIARYPLKDMPDEAAIDALKAELRERHGIGQPGSTLELHDSGATPAAKRKAVAARARRAPPMPRGLSASF